MSTESKIGFEITEDETSPRKIGNLATRPNASNLTGGAPLSSSQLRDRFDALPMLIIERFNDLLSVLGLRDSYDVGEGIKIVIGEGEKSLKEWISGNVSKIETEINESNVRTVTIYDLLDKPIASCQFDMTVTSDKIAASAVTAVKIDNGAITTEKILDRAVTSNKIAWYAVSNVNIADYAVTEKKIGIQAVTNSRIAGSAVTTDKIAQHSITSDLLAGDSVLTDRIVDEAVTTAKLKNSAVTKDKIMDRAVTESKIEAGAITEDKLSSLVSSALHKSICSVTYDSAAGKITFTDGNGSKAEVDIPLSQIITGAEYDEATESIVIKFQSGDNTVIPVSSILSGLINEVQELHYSMFSRQVAPPLSCLTKARLLTTPTIGQLYALTK